MLDLAKALLPSIALGLLFWYAMRNILRADRTERSEIEKYYSEQHSEDQTGEQNATQSAPQTEKAIDHSETGVKLTPTKTSEYEKSEHGKGDETRPHG